MDTTLQSPVHRRATLTDTRMLPQPPPQADNGQTPKLHQETTMPAPAPQTPMLTKSCPCAPCDCRSLAHPTLEPTTAELWVSKTPQHPQHADTDQREEYIERFGYAILNRPTVEIIRPYSPLLEVASGFGYWACELQHRNVHIVATDPHPEKEWPGQRPWTTVHRMDGLQALEAYPAHNLLFCWPEVDDWPTPIVTNFAHEYLLYVGEERGGCTGDTTMFDALDLHYTLVTDHRIPNFTGTKDRLFVYRRNRSHSLHQHPTPHPQKRENAICTSTSCPVAHPLRSYRP